MLGGTRSSRCALLACLLGLAKVGAFNLGLPAAHGNAPARRAAASSKAGVGGAAPSSRPVATVGSASWVSRPSALFMSSEAEATPDAAAPVAATETPAPPAAAASGAAPEEYEFQAEVSRVMDIIINSLYSNRDVFLRELVSNAADACDKKRFLSITEESASGPEQRIRIKANKEAKTLTIEDSGIGMTHDELKNNLGRIAQSGTQKFMDALGSGEADINLIGQFGVGFYSAFLVADKVSVITKSDQSDKQYRWESELGNKYTIAEDTSEPIEGSGSRLVLHLKDDAEEYLDDFKLKELAQKYSEFVSFPIQVWSESTKYEEVDDPDAEVEEGKEPKKKTVSKTEMEWVQTNKQKPIWMRNPKEVTDEEYSEFYKTTFKAWDELAAHTHFSLEGQVEFRAMLFVPSVLPYELSRNMFDENERNMRLYVKRVFINDKFEELVPRWLMFLRGLVDSEDLPLNVGREILQKSKMLTVINKRLVRKAIDMFKGIAMDEDKNKWETFSKNFGKYLKVGCVEDPDNKDELAKLVRFSSTHKDDDSVGFTDYVERMPEGQTNIYYVAAESKSAAKMVPSLEKAKKKGYEVIFLTDALDELCAESIAKFGEYNLEDLAKEGVAGLEDDDEKAAKDEQSEATEGFRDWLKDSIGKDRLQKVAVSSRLVDSPATLVQGAYGMSPTMQRYIKAQASAMGDGSTSMGMGQANQAVLEINPSHPIIKDLMVKYETAKDSEETTNAAMLLYDVAALTGGYSIDEPAAFAKRVTAAMMSGGSFGGGVEDAVVKEEGKKEEKKEEEAVEEKKEEKKTDKMETVDAEVV